ncbi:MAG TPA: YigZ family protein [Ignavibacteriaceae bacterium]|nr:YigZ family protein [Ignavibacteriaceae bacterium]
MNYPEQIKTIEGFNEFSIKEKGSVFIGQVFHNDNEEQLNHTLTDVKKKYYDASHHCYAYKLLNDKIKYSDDREPKGTAGIRILNAIEHFELVNQLVVVIRYFGGTKLGIGPLGKAYHTCAINVLQNSKISTRFLYQKVFIKSDFDNISRIHRVLGNYKVTIENVNYEQSAIINCFVRPVELNNIKVEIAEVTSGNAELTASEQIFYK